MSEQEDRIIRMDAVTLATGLSVATINRKEKAGEFPQRLKIGSRAVGWRSSAVQQWVEKQKENPPYVNPVTPDRKSAPIQGRVKFFCFDKGYGFIRNTDEDIFLHASELPHLYHPIQGDLVEYNTKQTRKGLVAIQVKFISRSDKYKHLDFAQPRHVAAAIPTTEFGGNREQ